ncbi:MAG: outer membrane lipoprotein-sorting protein [Gemmatimonadetes bacterium]|nr:outer membrane lipoprotein-sorting protein [Gemmatimonadota bacterium]NIO31465.1 outer membrane lipoprotein-sorting protein [Gemmatimonadota bacterium]
MLSRLAWCAVLALLLADSSLAPAQTPEERGLAIAREAERRSSGYTDYSARLTMVLRTRDGRERLREMRVSGLAMNGDGDRVLIVFEDPRDLAGTALLTYSHPQQSDDQWLYLPSLKRVKRIAAGNRAGSFMGSEFAYEDIGSQEVDKFTYRYVGDEILDGEQAFVVERRPVDSSSGYSRQTVWVDRAEYRPLRIDYYDNNGELLKTLRFVGYRQVAGAYWRADQMTMANHQTGRTTTLTWSDYAFDTGLHERDFSPSGLARAR